MRPANGIRPPSDMIARGKRDGHALRERAWRKCEVDSVAFDDLPRRWRDLLGNGVIGLGVHGRSGADEAVQHPLSACLFKLDLQLVAFDRLDRAIAELAVEHALTDR